MVIKNPTSNIGINNIFNVDPKRIRISKDNRLETDRCMINAIKIYYRQQDLTNFNINGKKFEVLHKEVISIPGEISEPHRALYKNELSRKTMELIRKTKPIAILYVYSGFKPVLSYKDENPSGFVELLFTRFLLKEK